MEKETQSLMERVGREDSHFVVYLQDGSVHSEADTNWSSMSTEMVCEYFGKKKTVMVCSSPVSKIKITHGDLITEIDIPEGCQVYQAMRSEVVFTPGQDIHKSISGRVVGIVRDGVIVEERFLDGNAGEVLGIKQ
jgi:hypothetical protein